MNLDEMLPRRTCTINVTNPNLEVITICGLSDPDNTL